MRTILAILVSFISVCSFANGKIDTLPSSNSLIIQLKALDLSAYQGQPVDSVVSHLPTGYLSMEIKPSILHKKAAFLIVDYGYDVAVVIGVRSFSYMNPELLSSGNPTQNWSITLFKKESVSFTVILNGNCINGCQDLGKFN